MSRVHEFCGFAKGVIGKKLPADSTLKNMSRAELVELLHIAQHNYDALMFAYDNAVKMNIKLNDELELREKLKEELKLSEEDKEE